jgi:hypothetical protein
VKDRSVAAVLSLSARSSATAAGRLSTTATVCPSPLPSTVGVTSTVYVAVGSLPTCGAVWDDHGSYITTIPGQLDAIGFNPLFNFSFHSHSGVHLRYSF